MIRAIDYLDKEIINGYPQKIASLCISIITKDVVRFTC